jgi:hypothetical protein
MTLSAEDRRRTEQWFISRGLPHYIEDYSASKDIFTRALPLLTLVFVFEVFTALNLDWPWWGNILAVVGAFALLGAILVGLNALRGRRLFSLPHRVGVVEVLLFVLAPPILPLVFGGKGEVGLVTIATNAVLLLTIYFFTSYGVVPMTRWAAVKLWSQLGALFRLLTRALPLLLLFVTFLFLNPDTWQVAGRLYGIYFTSSLLLFAIIGAAFVATRMPQEIGDLNNFTSPEEVRAEVAAAGLDGSGFSDVIVDTPMSRRQWGNTGLVVMVSQAIQVLLVAFIVAAFLLVLGLLTIRPGTEATWVGGKPPHKLLSVDYGHEQLVLTEELLRVSVFLAAFSALYFTVVALTDSAYREEFFREVVSEVRQALAVRIVYLDALRR